MFLVLGMVDVNGGVPWMMAALARTSHGVCMMLARWGVLLGIKEAHAATVIQSITAQDLIATTACNILNSPGCIE